MYCGAPLGLSAIDDLEGADAVVSNLMAPELLQLLQV